MCSTGGKINILKHGQTASMNKQSVKNADPKEQQNINPLFNYEEFQEEEDEDLDICN